MIDLVLIALLQAAAGDPAPAAETPPQQTQQTEQAQGQPESQPAEERRCRREVVVGTRMTRRVCTTPSEDRAAEQEARRLTDRAQSQMGLQAN